MQRVKRESLYFLSLFLLLALAMHFSAWMTHPIKQIEMLPGSPLGVWHPLFLTLIVYIAVVVVRVMIYATRSLLRRK